MKIIVALCKNFGIGVHNKLPWNIKKDLFYFKNKTIGNRNNAIIMGKNTWNSLPKKPLPNRFNCILSSSLDIDDCNAKTFKNTSDLDTFIENKNFDDVWIIGGENVYNKYIFHPNLNEIYITKIEEDFMCDTYFPNLPFYFSLKQSSNNFNENNINFKFQIYKKDTYKS